MDSPLQVVERRSISVSTPVYNGERSASEVCRRVGEVLLRVTPCYADHSVNDCKDAA